MALPLSVAGVLLTHGAIVWYFLVINRERVPVRVAPFASVLVAGVALTAAAVALGPGWLTGGLLAVNAAMGGFILWLLTQRRLPDGQLVVSVGDPLPPLRATTDTGEPFDLARLEGRRLMVKFFRGSW